jgi:hypothetical protein
MPTLLADDTSIIYANPNLIAFKNEINTLFATLNIWFETNLLSVNYSKTRYMHFWTKTNYDINLCISYGINEVNSTHNTKFLGLIIDNTVSWKNHIDNLLSKVSSAGYAIRFLKPFMSPNNFGFIYFSYVHSMITYAIMFWGISPHSKSVFKSQEE